MFEQEPVRGRVDECEREIPFSNVTSKNDLKNL
jgi:hypothetical protein